jgi:hypothetical protein
MSEKIVIKTMVVVAAVARAIMAVEDARRRGQGDRGVRCNININHLKKIECYNCGQKGHYSTDCTAPKKN